MTNLMGEIEKAAAHCTTGEIKRYNIDAVCSPVLDAVVFDLTDAITRQEGLKKQLPSSGICLRLKNNEVIIFTDHHAPHPAPVCCQDLRRERAGETGICSEMIGSKSPFYAKTDTERGAACCRFRLAAPGGFALCAHTDVGAEGKRRQTGRS